MQEQKGGRTNRRRAVRRPEATCAHRTIFRAMVRATTAINAQRTTRAPGTLRATLQIAAKHHGDLARTGLPTRIWQRVRIIARPGPVRAQTQAATPRATVRTRRRETLAPATAVAMRRRNHAPTQGQQRLTVLPVRRVAHTRRLAAAMAAVAPRLVLAVVDQLPMQAAAVVELPIAVVAAEVARIANSGHLLAFPNGPVSL